MEVIELVPPAPLVLELKTKKVESSVHIYIHLHPFVSVNNIILIGNSILYNACESSDTAMVERLSAG